MPAAASLRVVCSDASISRSNRSREQPIPRLSVFASPSRSGRRCACATASRFLKSGRKKTSTGAISSPGVSADLTRRTLFGRAITVGAAGQYESLERLGRVFVNTPTLFGRFVQSSLTLERSREEFRDDTLVTDSHHGAWEQRGRWRKLTMSYGLRFERNHTFDTGPLDPDLSYR